MVEISEKKIVENKEKYIHDVFNIGIALKGLDGLLQVLGGIALLFIKPDTLNDWARHIPLYHASFNAASEKFGIIFLLTHGLVKIIIVAALLKNKFWAYPVGIVVFAGFGIYQLNRYFHTHSLGMLILTILDAIVILLTWHEYRIIKQRTLAATLQ